MAYYAQGGPFEDFTGGEATNNSRLGFRLRDVPFCPMGIYVQTKISIKLYICY